MLVDIFDNMIFNGIIEFRLMEALSFRYPSPYFWKFGFILISIVANTVKIIEHVSLTIFLICF